MTKREAQQHLRNTFPQFPQAVVKIAHEWLGGFKKQKWAVRIYLHGEPVTLQEPSGSGFGWTQGKAVAAAIEDVEYWYAWAIERAA